VNRKSDIVKERETLRTFAQMMADFTFSLTYDSIPAEVSTAARRHLADRNRALDTQGILGVRLMAELTDGRMEEIIVHQPKGHPDAPLSDAELLEKMSWLVENIAPADTPIRLVEICSRLSTPEHVEELLETCHVRQK